VLCSTVVLSAVAAARAREGYVDALFDVVYSQTRRVEVRADEVAAAVAAVAVAVAAAAAVVSVFPQCNASLCVILQARPRERH
jgi:hypothetical protein